MSSSKIPKNLGTKLKFIRLHFGYTLEEMADAVGKEGLSRRSRVHEWERGVRAPDLPCLLTYAKLLGISTDVLLDDSTTLNLESSITDERIGSNSAT